ncbi:MAG: alpha/beta hydrolase [SAR202 cluster bacterium]|nr:alpha/beta hydrolase [SAR202 cluster bacterium]
MADAKHSGKELIQEKGSRGLTDEGLVHIPGLSSRWVRLASGAKAHYMTAGDYGPAVILLHGGINGSSGTAGWRFMAPFLAQHGFRLYCPDQPGFGHADTDPKYWPHLGTVSHVEFVKEFADALCIDKFHLAGNSMGCTNTVHFVVRYPERVLSFALIAGGVGDLVDPAKRVAPKDGKFTPNPNYVRPPFDGTEESMRMLMAGIIYNAGAVWPELVTMRTQAAHRQKDSYDVLQKARENFEKDANLKQLLTTKGRLDKLTIPGIYLYGKQDVLIPVENGFQQEDVLPNVQFFYPDECGHQGQTDQPEMFNQVFLEFFRDGKVSRKTADWAGVSKRRPELKHLWSRAPSRPASAMR